MIGFSYVRSQSIPSATSAVAKGSSKFIAGGTNLVDLMKRGIIEPQNLVDITALPLKGIEKTKTGLRIGALALNSDVAENAIVQQEYPLLSLALSAGASPQIRNMATVGGNLLQRTRCSYFYDTAAPCNKRKPGSGCAALQGYNRMHAIFGASTQCIAVHPSDMCIALAALDAQVVVSNGRSEKRIRFADFHRLPGTTPERDTNLAKDELITAIEIEDAKRFATHSRYNKIRDRASYAFALVSVAAALDMNGNTIREARLAMGGVAHKPWRLAAAELFLRGKEASERTFRDAAAIAMKDAKAYGHNQFKLKLAPATLVNTLMEASGI